MGSDAAETAGLAAREMVRDAAPATADFDEYAFLLPHGLTRETLRRACRLATQWGTPPHEVLIANGWIGETAYHRALAQRCGAGFVGPRESDALAPPGTDGDPRECLRQGLLRRKRAGAPGLAFSPGRARPNTVSAILGGDVGKRVAITTRAALCETVLRSFGARLMRQAVHGLAARSPDECANRRMSRAQRGGLAMAAALIVVFAAIAPLETLRIVTGLATLFFALVVGLRVAACIHLALAMPARLMRRSTRRIPEAELPVYTVLVPLFREANVAPGLIRALGKLDYPALCIKRTKAARNASRLPEQGSAVQLGESTLRRSHYAYDTA